MRGRCAETPVSVARSSTTRLTKAARAAIEPRGSERARLSSPATRHARGRRGRAGASGGGRRRQHRSLIDAGDRRGRVDERSQMATRTCWPRATTSAESFILDGRAVFVAAFICRYVVPPLSKLMDRASRVDPGVARGGRGGRGRRRHVRRRGARAALEAARREADAIVAQAHRSAEQLLAEAHGTPRSTTRLLARAEAEVRLGDAPGCASEVTAEVAPSSWPRPSGSSTAELDTSLSQHRLIDETIDAAEAEMAMTCTTSCAATPPRPSSRPRPPAARRGRERSGDVLAGPHRVLTRSATCSPTRPSRRSAVAVSCIDLLDDQGRSRGAGSRLLGGAGRAAPSELPRWRWSIARRDWPSDEHGRVRRGDGRAELLGRPHRGARADPRLRRAAVLQEVDRLRR